MKNYIACRWIGANTALENKDRFNQDLAAHWHEGSIKKFWSISPECRTARGILEQFNNDEWRSYKKYNKQYPNWEYLVLLKLVVMGCLQCRTSIINGRDTLVFKNPKPIFDQVMEQLELFV
jgi:hypothetical protein